MKVILVTPWENAWVPYFKAAFEARGHEFECRPDAVSADVVLHGWASGDSQPVDGAKNVMFMRRYELFEGGINRVRWPGVDHLICVNSWIANIAGSVLADRYGTKVHLIYNGTDVNTWRFKVREPGKKMGMACHVHPKKNLPLAVQILGLLPEDYELHIAGAIQDSCTAEYLNNLGKALKRKVYLYDHIDAGMMSMWWEQMSYCLSTSISEGNPNNVIEAMAKGIKPIVHRWPGAEDQFADHLFDLATDAARMIQSNAYDSYAYRAEVEKKFSLQNIEKVVECVKCSKRVQSNISKQYRRDIADWKELCGLATCLMALRN
jgi:glycosyltransferase involved in cell wall biosynthesis